MARLRGLHEYRPVQLSSVRWGLVALPLTLVSGCATISVSSETIATKAGNDRVTRAAVPESRLYDVAVTTRNRMLVTSIGQFEVCEVTTTPRLHRVQKNRRTITGGLRPTASLLVGAGLAAGGIYGIVGLGSASGGGSGSASTTATAYQIGGAALVGAGLSFAVIGIVDLIRSQDSVEDLGVADGEPMVERVNCNQTALPANTKVRLRTGATVLDSISVEGKAAFSMMGVPLADLPLESSRGLILGIGGSTVPVVLSSEERASLKQQLEQDQSSKYWIDTRSARQASCEKLTNEARAVSLDASASPEALDTALFRWKAAQEGCGALWTRELATDSWSILSAGARGESARLKRTSDALVAKKSQLARATSLQSAAEFESALDAGDAALTRCKSLLDRLAPIADACSQLDVAVTSARDFRDKLSDKLEAMRVAHEEAAARKQDAAAAKLWRSHFGKCQELIRAVRRLEQVSYRGQCGADCLTAAAKMRGEAERLSEFEVNIEISDEALAERLQLECQAAGCSACP